MPKGGTHRFGRVVAGLLFLTGLLLSGLQDPAAAAPLHAGHHHDRAMTQAADAGLHGPAIISGAHHADHALPCCAGCECVMHAAVFAISPTAFPVRHAFGLAYLPDRAGDLAGIATLPASPPPRPAA
jgi:hypothetical protein